MKAIQFGLFTGKPTPARCAHARSSTGAVSTVGRASLPGANSRTDAASCRSFLRKKLW